MADPELLKVLELDEFVVLDFETTGFSAELNQIIEMAAVRFRNGELAGEYRQLVNPNEPIPREIVDITNITDEMVAGEPPIEEVGQELLDFLGGSPLVAHNLPFDLSFLKTIYRKLGQSDEIGGDLYDTVTLARTFLFHRSGYSLAALCEYYELDHSNAHRAYNDALNTGALFLNLIEEAARYPLPVMQSMLAVQDHVNLHNKKLYRNLTKAMLASGQNTGLMAAQSAPVVYEAFYQREGAGDDYGPQTAEVFFGAEGTLAEQWDEFESRPIQAQFSQAVTDSFDDNSILLAEAGTGLGKSMAYLLPAINAAYQHGRPIVIACHTKHLQDQLFRTEIPRLAQLLNAPVRAVMLKGRGNYLCRTRLQFALDNAKRLLSPDDCENMLPIILWEQFTRSGDIDECAGFQFGRGGRLWRLLRSERGYCVGNSCQRYHGCFVGPLRREVRQADLIVVNHALLLADAAGEGGLLPQDFRLVLDEAHNLAKVTTEQLTTEFGAEIVSDLAENYRQGRFRRIFRKQLEEALLLLDEEGGLYGRIREAAKSIKDKTASLLDSYSREHKIAPNRDGKQFFRQNRYIDPAVEFRGLEIEVGEVAEAFRVFVDELKQVQRLIATTDAALPEGLLNDVESDLDEAVTLMTVFRRLALDEPAGDFVLWRDIRGKANGIQLRFKSAPLGVSDFLRERLFSLRPGTVLCSATLQTGGSFDFFRREVGLDAAFDAWDVHEHEYPSPFLYSEQCAAFYWDTPTDVSSDDYPLELANMIDELTDRIPRRLLVLFTSYAQLRAVNEVLHSRLFRTERRLLTQFSRSSRWGLLQAFKENPRSILLGTSSFWEGVDLPGDLLEMLIIARLPFANPSEPVIEARLEHLQDQGLNAFMDYQVPDAITRFRQGFGRLIRTSYDEGLFIVADSRVGKRRYGHNFLDALPVELLPFATVESIVNGLRGKVFRQDIKPLQQE